MGDLVVFNPPKYKGIVFGTVIGFTPKMIKIRYDSTGKQSSDETRVEPFNIVKIKELPL